MSDRSDIPTDRVEFARLVGLEPDAWQERLLRSDAPRVLMNNARQTGKSTATGVLALHKALTAPCSLTLILAPAERQAKELFSKVAEAYRTLGHVIPADSYRKLGMGTPLLFSPCIRKSRGPSLGTPAFTLLRLELLP